MNELKIHPNARSMINVPLGTQDGASMVIQSVDSKKDLDQEIKTAMANDRLAVIEAPNNVTSYFNPKQFSVFHTVNISKLQVVPAGAIPDIKDKSVQ